jgi:hypothetical protein
VFGHLLVVVDFLPDHHPSSPQKTMEKLTSLTASLGRITASIESGQAQRPLSDSLEKLTTSEARQAKIVLVGVEREQTAALLGSILPNEIDASTCAKLIPAGDNPTEIHLADQFALLSPSHQPFDDAAKLVDALKRFDEDINALPSVAAGHLKISVSVHNSAQPPARLLVSPLLEQLADSPVTLSTLAESSSWLVLVSPEGFVPDRKQLAALGTISSSALGFTLIQAGEPVAATSWLRQIPVPVSAPPLSLAAREKLEAAFLSLSQQGGLLRQSLDDWRKREQLEDLMIIVKEELGQSKRSLERQRLLHDEGLGKTDSNGGRALQELQTRIRNLLQDGIDGIVKEIERKNSALLQPGGKIHGEIKMLADELEPGNLDQTINHDRIRLSLTSTKEEVFCHVLQREAKAVVAEDLALIKKKSDQLLAEANQLLAREIGNAQQLRINSIRATSFETDVGLTVQPEIRYRGEMPRMTFGRRFSAARSWMMPVMMAAMFAGAAVAVGGSGNNSSSGLRSIMMMLAGVALIAGFAWTYFSQEKKEEGQLERELERVRDGVLQEIRRVINDIFRREQQLLKDHFQKNTRELGNQLGAIIRQEEQKCTEQSKSAQMQNQSSSRTIDQKLRDLQQWTVELDRLMQRTGEAARDIIAAALKHVRG